MQIVTRHADPRTTMRYDRARKNLDRHPNYILAAGVPKSTWVRQAIEVALATQADQDEPISRADALRALTLLRTIRHVAQS